MYSENFPICRLYLFWLTATEFQVLKMRFDLLQFILNNLNVDCGGLHWTSIISASAFIILLSSNFLILMPTWYFCKVPIYLGEFQMGSVIMSQQFSVSPHVQIGWWYCLSGGSLACWPLTIKLDISWSSCYRSQWSLVMLWISVSLLRLLVSSLGSHLCNGRWEILDTLQSHLDDDLFSYIFLPPFFLPLLFTSCPQHFETLPGYVVLAW